MTNENKGHGIHTRRDFSEGLGNLAGVLEKEIEAVIGMNGMKGMMVDYEWAKSERFERYA